MACSCCTGPKTGIRLGAILSLLLAAGVIVVSGKYFLEVNEERNIKGSKTLDATGTFVTSGFITLGINEKIDRIKLSCSGAVFGDAILQFMTSVLLFCNTCIEQGRSTAKFYAVINTFVMLILVSAVACFLASKLNYEDGKIQLFLGACAIDSIFLIYPLGVTVAYV